MKALVQFMLLLFCGFGYAQVGVNTTSPFSSLDINGDLALREGPTLVLPNSATPAATLTAGSEYSHYRVTGPTVSFTLQTISGGNDGQVLTLINNTGQTMSIANNNVANGILTGTGANLAGFTSANSSVTLVYNSTIARWIVTSSSGFSASKDWKINGNAGITSPATPATYGTSVIASTENYMGTTDANDIVFGTNNIERVRIKQTTGNVGIGTSTPSEMLHVYKNSDADKNVILGEARQISTSTDYNNIGVRGFGRGGNPTWGYGVGVAGVADQANSWFAAGVYAGLGTAVSLQNTDTALYSNGNSIGYSGIFMNGNAGFATLYPSELVELGGTNSKLFMNSGSSNMISFNTAGVADPAFTTRSIGTKLILYPQVTASTSDYAIGIAGSTLWSTIPEATSTYSFKWYSGVTEGMRFRGDGRLGIGITAPTATRLQAYDPSISTTRIAIFRNGNVDGTEVQTGSVEYLHDYSSTTDFNDGANSVGLTVNYAGTSTYDLQLAANSAGKPTSGSWTIVSDARLKEDIHSFKDGLSILKQINPVYFKYNGKAKTPSNEYGIGVIAQDMQQIAPYMVGRFQVLPNEEDKSNIEEYLSYNPDALHYININAIKELDDKVNKIAEQKTISDFGVATLSNSVEYISFEDSFSSKIANNKLPVVTATPLTENVQISILSQDKNGFKVKVSGNNGNPVTINWIAMAKSNIIDSTEIKHTVQERADLISKVKLPEPSLKTRIERESKELEKFKSELKANEAKDIENTKAAIERMNQNPKPIEPPSKK